MRFALGNDGDRRPPLRDDGVSCRQGTDENPRERRVGVIVGRLGVVIERSEHFLRAS